MKLNKSPIEQIELLRKLLNTKQHELETNLGELHNRKNDLNLLTMLLTKSEKAKDKNKTGVVDVALLKQIISDCYNGLIIIHKSLNSNPAKLSGLAGALRIQVNSCEIRFHVNIESDFSFPEGMETAGSQNAPVYLSCALAIEMFCLRGYSDLLVTLSGENGNIEFGIFGTGLEKKREQEDLAGEKFDELKGVLVWAGAKMHAETNWKNQIKFTIATE